MDLPQTDIPDTPAQRAQDRGRVLRAFNLSLAAVLLLVLVFFAQSAFDVRAFAVAPHEARGLIGILTAPLLHGGLTHLATNSIAILMLGTLAGSVYPKASLRALPLLWICAGLGAWLLGDVGQRHLGASGVTHGLGFLIFVLGLLLLRQLSRHRRPRRLLLRRPRQLRRRNRRPLLPLSRPLPHRCSTRWNSVWELGPAGFRLSHPMAAM